MKKIKIIDLLNKVANGEEVPKKIKYENETRVYNENDRDYESIGDRANTELYLFYGVLCSRTGELFKKCLNDEVEIIEDEIVEDEIVEDVPKEVNGIKKLNLTGENQLKLKTNKQEYNIRVVDKIIINKINEIIDKEY